MKGGDLMPEDEATNAPAIIGKGELVIAATSKRACW